MQDRLIVLHSLKAPLWQARAALGAVILTRANGKTETPGRTRITTLNTLH
jgi:hypothetical protein